VIQEVHHQRLAVVFNCSVPTVRYLIRDAKNTLSDSKVCFVNESRSPQFIENARWVTARCVNAIASRSTPYVCFKLISELPEYELVAPIVVLPFRLSRNCSLSVGMTRRLIVDSLEDSCVDSRGRSLVRV